MLMDEMTIILHTMHGTIRVSLGIRTFEVLIRKSHMVNFSKQKFIRILRALMASDKNNYIGQKNIEMTINNSLNIYIIQLKR